MAGITGPGNALESSPPAINLDRAGRTRNDSHFGHTNFSFEAFVVRSEYAREARALEGPPGPPEPPPYITPGPPPDYTAYPRNGEITVDRNTRHELGEPHYQSEYPDAWAPRRRSRPPQPPFPPPPYAARPDGQA